MMWPSRAQTPDEVFAFGWHRVVLTLLVRDSKAWAQTEALLDIAARRDPGARCFMPTAEAMATPGTLAAVGLRLLASTTWGAC